MDKTARFCNRHLNLLLLPLPLALLARATPSAVGVSSTVGATTCLAGLMGGGDLYVSNTTLPGAVAWCLNNTRCAGFTAPNPGSTPFPVGCIIIIVAMGPWRESTHPTTHTWCTPGQRVLVLAVLVAELRLGRRPDLAALPSLARAAAADLAVCPAARPRPWRRRQREDSTVCDSRCTKVPVQGLGVGLGALHSTPLARR